MNADQQPSMVDALRLAVERSDPAWVSQPSHLRRRLDQVLGSSAKPQRTQVHQLVVAAEERIPVRLQRNGWSPTERDELIQLLIDVRGWTEPAAAWAVITWGGALGLTDEVAVLPAQRPRPVAPETAVAPRTAPPVSETILPSVIDPTHVPDANELTLMPQQSGTGASVPDSSTEDKTVPKATPRPVGPRPLVEVGPTVMPGQDPLGPSTPQVEIWDDLDAASDPSAGQVPEPDATPGPLTAPPSTPVAAATPSSELPTKGTKRSTQRAQAFLESQLGGRELDVAYLVKAGPNPALLFCLLPLAILSLFIPAGGLLIMVFAIAMFIGTAVWPTRMLAVSGDDVWLLRANAIGQKPTSLVATGARHEVAHTDGTPFPAVTFADERLWFQYPVTKGARALAPRPTQPAPNPTTDAPGGAHE